MAERSARFVSRGGEKLQAALDGFGLSVGGWVCADFGVNVGGFTDCLLQAGAVKVYALDTGYGALDWRLRKDPRVVVMERTNALYAPLPADVGPGMELVTIDVAFTPQRLIVPAAAKWLRPDGRIISLLKPHYEAQKLPRRPVRKGTGQPPLDDAEAVAIRDEVCQELASMGLAVQAVMPSPLRGKGGNVEFLLLLEPRHLLDAPRHGP